MHTLIKRSRWIVGAMTMVASCWAMAQSDYPSRSITVVAPYSAGGDSDAAARNFAQSASEALKVPVVVLNKEGASGIIGSNYVISAPADGYTLLLARVGSQGILPAITPSVTKYKWDDFTFIGMLELNPYGCVVHADSPYKTFGELVEAIKTKGTGLNYGTAGHLTSNDMGPRRLFQLLKLGSGQTPTQIPYKGTGDTVSSLLAKETHFSCGSIGPFLTQIKANKLRALIITTPERIPSLPDVPTARELGVPEMESVIGWSAIYGPPGMPEAVVKRLSDVMLQHVAKDPNWIKRTEQMGSIPFIKSPEQTRDFARKQHELYRSLGESLNIIDAKK
jgi:Uncharacterized protein conserved in bacteria